MEVVVRDGEEIRRKYVFSPGEYVVGRDAACEILVKGAGVSFSHARLVISPSKLKVIDLGSTNGTFVGDLRVEGAKEISLGERVSVGAAGSLEVRLLDRVEILPEDQKPHSGEKRKQRGAEPPAEQVTDAVKIGGKAVPEEAPVEEISRQMDELREQNAALLKAVEQERKSAAKARKQLRLEAEKAEREKAALDAATTQEWTAILIEKECALETLAEERAMREYQKRDFEQKLNALREEQRKLGETVQRLQKAEADRQKEKEEASERRLAQRVEAFERQHAAAQRETESRLDAALQTVELQRAELANLREESARRSNDPLSKERPQPPQPPEPAAISPGPAVREGDRKLGKNCPELEPPAEGKKGRYGINPPAFAKTDLIAVKAPGSGRGSKQKAALATQSRRLQIDEPSSLADGADQPANSRPNKQLWRVAILCACLGLPAAAIGSYRAYQTWQLRNLTTAATSALLRGDYEEASLGARRALQMNENHRPACRLMAEIGEKAADPRAITWRQRAVELAPGSADELIAYASTALRFGKRTLAVEALGRVDPSQRDRADFHLVSGAVAAASGDQSAAERAYAEAVRLNPNDPARKVDLGAAQARSEDFFTREAGRRLLSESSSHPEVGVRALRALIESYERTRELTAALRASRQLANTPQASFSDELVFLKLLRQNGQPEYSAALAKTRAKASAQPAQAASLAAWMNAEGLASEAVEWATLTNPEVAKMPGVAPVLAGSFASTGDWPALLELTQGAFWPGAEHVRYAYRARGLRESSRVDLADSAWASAIMAASADPVALAWLARISSDWKWTDENEAALLALVGKSESRQPLKILADRYMAEGDTQGLRRLAARLMDADPADDDAQNDYAILSLLLNVDTARAMRIAHDLHQRHPEHPGYTSTYAFALNYDGRSAEALRLTRQLPAAQLEDPAFAAYHGIFLVANGAREQGTRFLEIAREAPLLKEELHLVEKALASVGSNRASVAE